MPLLQADKAQLHYELEGDGAPVVLVHGSWDDASTWARVARRLARTNLVATYDRRGHSRSAGGDAPGMLAEDVDDLETLVSTLGLAPAHIVSSSLGGNVALRLAGRRRELFASVVVHEPPLFALLEGDPEAANDLAAVRAALGDVRAALERGDHEEGARLFVERVASEPGAWESMSGRMREMFAANAGTFLDEMRGGDQEHIELEPLRAFDRTALLTQGTESPSYFRRPLARLADVLPRAEKHVFEGAGHVPHATHRDEYVRVIGDFVARAESARRA